MTVQLIGLDGRVRSIGDDAVQNFLRRGWMRKPEGMVGNYSPIHDRRGNLPLVPPKDLKEVTEPFGGRKVLEVTKI